ncbi:hypothetical protein RZS08_53680, partial [Arthrospira platensis SPKY1]|nr:hypothetical protein [Arthrospira platensis SPKY1]
ASLWIGRPAPPPASYPMAASHRIGSKPGLHRLASSQPMDWQASPPAGKLYDGGKPSYRG